MFLVSWNPFKNLREIINNHIKQVTQYVKYREGYDRLLLSSGQIFKFL